MSYQETVSDIEKEFGIFPGFLKGVPQDVLMQMWPIMKRYILGESWQKWQQLLDRLLFGVMYSMRIIMTSIHLQKNSNQLESTYQGSIKSL